MNIQVYEVDCWLKSPNLKHDVICNRRLFPRLFSFVDSCFHFLSVSPCFFVCYLLLFIIIFLFFFLLNCVSWPSFDYFFFSAVSFFVPFFFLIFPFGSVLRKPRQHFLLPFGWVLFCLPSSSRPTAPFRPRTHRGPSARKNPPTNTAMIFTFYLNWVGIYRQLAYQTISSFFNKYPNHNAS